MARFVFCDIYLLFSFLALFSFLCGFINFLSKYDENGCEMTYMYEYPQFVRISMPEDVSEIYKRYGLYAYAEGRFIEKTRQMKFDGIPVLFIPGHSGSFKQVRSLASVSLRKSLGSRTPFHFDFFTTDLNEEYSGLFGGVLKDQTRFVLHAIEQIFTLYKKNVPDSVVLIGHSMGGVLAKGLFLEPDFNKDKVRLLITLATPHLPVILLDKMAAYYYHNIGPSWIDEQDVSLTMVSVGGGPKDLIVRSGLTIAKETDINVLSTGVPSVWTSTDHLCILWCKQLVIVLVRALFDSVDLRTLQISQDKDLVKRVFQYQLMDRSAGKRFETSQHPPRVTLWDSKSHPGDWIEPIGKQISIKKPNGVLRSTYYMFRIVEQYKNEMMAISAYNHKGRDWIFACKASTVVGNMRVCEEGENLSHLARIAPTKTFKHKVAYLNLTKISSKGHQFVVIKIPFTNQLVEVHYDVHPYLPRLVTPKNHWIAPYKTQILKESQPRALRYTVHLPNFLYMWQAFRLHMFATNCTDSYETTATVSVPWSNENTFFVSRNKDYLNIPVLLQTSQPHGWKGNPVTVHLHLDPACTYSLHIQSSPIDSLGEIVRVHSTELLSYMAAISLLAVKYQMDMMASQQHCVMFYIALVEGAKPYMVIPIVRIASKLSRSLLVTTSLSAYIPMPDEMYRQENGTDFLLLPLLLYSVAFATIFLLGISIYTGIIFSGQTINKVVTSFVVSRLIGFRSWSEKFVQLMNGVPFSIAISTMLTLRYSACEGLVLIFGAVYYFLKICSMYEDCLEHLWMTPLRQLKRKFLAMYYREGSTQVPTADEEEEEDTLDIDKLTTALNFHLTLLILWGIASIVYIPSVLVWAHNYKYDSLLKQDPAYNVSIIMCLVGIVLWRLDTPFVCSFLDMYSECGKVISAFVVLVMLYTPVSVHNLPTLLIGSFAVIASHQFYLFTLRLSQTHQEQDTEIPLLIPVEDMSKETSEHETDSGEEKSDNDVKMSSTDDKTDEESIGDSDNLAKSNLSRKNSMSELSLSSSYEAVSLSESTTKKKND